MPKNGFTLCPHMVIWFSTGSSWERISHLYFKDSILFLLQVLTLRRVKPAYSLQKFQHFFNCFLGFHSNLNMCLVFCPLLPVWPLSERLSCQEQKTYLIFFLIFMISYFYLIPELSLFKCQTFRINSLIFLLSLLHYLTKSIIHAMNNIQVCRSKNFTCA